MLIKNYLTCQERLPGMPGIGVEPDCALTSMEKPCENPTYETCPRYEPVHTRFCPICDGRWFKDTVDWVFVCEKCGREFGVVEGAMAVIKDRAG